MNNLGNDHPVYGQVLYMKLLFGKMRYFFILTELETISFH